MKNRHHFTDLPDRLFGRSRIIVLGNSGSLLDTPRQEDWRDPGLLVIGVNRMLRTGLDGRRYYPDLLVVSDNRVIRSDHDLIKSADDTIHLAAPPWVSRSERDTFYFPARKRRNNWRLPVEIGKPLESYNNVTLHALQLACLMAAPIATIFLMGVEKTWPTLRDERGDRHHFYNQQDICRKIRPFRFHRRSDHFFGIIRRHFGRCRPGVNIVDLSPWRDLALGGFDSKNPGKVLTGRKTKVVEKGPEKPRLAKCSFSVVIPQRGNQQLTETIVRQLRLCHKDHDLDIVVVNDASGHTPIVGAGMVDNLGKGVTAAWNRGIRCCKHENIVLLNNDVVCSSEFLPALSRQLSSDVIIGPTWRQERAIGGNSDRLPGGSESEWLEGWCLAFTKSTWRKLGGFDNRMGLYFSDLDFQVRAVRRGLFLETFDFPLTHLGHKTAHDPQICPDRRERWLSDRRVFIETL